MNLPTLPLRTLAAALALGLGLSLAAPSAHAQAVRDDDGEEVIVSSAGFLAYHPDIRHRAIGMGYFRDGKFREAMTRFRMAARFADKPSQGLIGEMFWNGDGVPQDRALAYAWMDLAAERGYRLMAIKREQYWLELSAEERERAIAEGEKLYAEFGDEVAKPRLEARLRQGRRNSVGSRTGFMGNVKIELYTPTGPVSIDGSKYYNEAYWDPQQYWAWQDEGWTRPPTGVVSVGDLRDMDTGDIRQIEGIEDIRDDEESGD